ncbi:ABC transporter permease [Gracilibacillus alcaliphilus]|uniref:ABC transporter permease n=1 Tax=Gracilibacillus alcaliphilus TaxID=1401441 RepID=UPI00195C8FA7|nr:ABC transporter permease [Gracilibacillus alcaliphilus]MBM7675784.1 ABC-2 type transport system permease protein [Gracilibacillus alcaliphilus]
MNAIMKVELKKHLQDKGLVFWMLILPILFTILFISIFTAGADNATKQEVIQSIVPGYVVMFVFFIMISMVQIFIKDRDKGMTARLASTPIKSYYYLLGKWLPFMYIVLIQIVVLFLFGKLVYDVSLEEPLVLLMLSLFITFTVTAIGLAMALTVHTENMGIAFTQIIALGGAMLSGLWIPFDMMPSFMQTIGRFLPQYWAHQSFQDAMAGTTQVSELFQTLGILFAIGLAAFIIAIIRYPYFLKRAVK